MAYGASSKIAGAQESMFPHFFPILPNFSSFFPRKRDFWIITWGLPWLQNYVRTGFIIAPAAIHGEWSLAAQDLRHSRNLRCFPSIYPYLKAWLLLLIIYIMVIHVYLIVHVEKNVSIVVSSTRSHLLLRNRLWRLSLLGGLSVSISACHEESNGSAACKAVSKSMAPWISNSIPSCVGKRTRIRSIRSILRLSVSLKRVGFPTFGQSPIFQALIESNQHWSNCRKGLC